MASSGQLEVARPLWGLVRRVVHSFPWLETLQLHTLWGIATEYVVNYISRGHIEDNLALSVVSHISCKYLCPIPVAQVIAATACLSK